MKNAKGKFLAVFISVMMIVFTTGVAYADVMQDNTNMANNQKTLTEENSKEKLEDNDVAEKYIYEQVSEIDDTDAKYLIVALNRGCWGYYDDALNSTYSNTIDNTIGFCGVNVYNKSGSYFDIKNVKDTMLWSFNKTGNLDSLSGVKLRDINGMELVINENSVSVSESGDKLNIQSSSPEFSQSNGLNISSQNGFLDCFNSEFSIPRQYTECIRIFKQVNIDSLTSNNTNMAITAKTLTEENSNEELASNDVTQKYVYEEVSSIDDTNAKYVITALVRGCWGYYDLALNSVSHNTINNFSSVNVYNKSGSYYDIKNVKDTMLWSFNKTGDLASLSDFKLRDSNGMELVIDKNSISVSESGDNLKIQSHEPNMFHIYSEKAMLDCFNEGFSIPTDQAQCIRIFKQVNIDSLTSN